MAPLYYSLLFALVVLLVVIIPPPSARADFAFDAPKMSLFSLVTTKSACEGEDPSTICVNIKGRKAIVGLTAVIKLTDKSGEIRDELTIEDLNPSVLYSKPLRGSPQHFEGYLTLEVQDGGGATIVATSSPAIVFHPDVHLDTDNDLFGGNLVLGRPTDTSIACNVYLATQAADTFLLYRESGDRVGEVFLKTEEVEMEAGSPQSFQMSHMEASKTYKYLVCFSDIDVPTNEYAVCNGPYSFVTQKQPGEPFTFTLDADAEIRMKAEHDGGPDSAALLMQTMAAVAREKPDLHFDLGDFTMQDKFYMLDLEGRLTLQLDKRQYFAKPALHSVPFFMVRGNHEGESGWFLEGDPEKDKNSIAVISALSRKMAFDNPFPDGSFYTGNENEYSYNEVEVGFLENYYEFTWGDAQFIVLDPFWHTKFNSRWAEEINRNPAATKATGLSPKRWEWTLGKEQYDWLSRVLGASTAVFKFVMIHHLFHPRGGESNVPYYEWGGEDPNFDAEDLSFNNLTFAQQRPDWAMPIHDLLVSEGVNVVFHGHDHLWAYEPRKDEGIVYQELPKPNQYLWETSQPNCDKGYYKNCQPNSGFTRVRVTDTTVQIEYIRQYLNGGSEGEINGEVMCGYTITHKDNAVDEIVHNDNCITKEWTTWY